MSNTIPSAAPQHGAAALKDHLAPVVELLSRSLAPSKYEQTPGARRWQMAATWLRSAYTGLKAGLAMIGLAALAGLLVLAVQEDGLVGRLQAAAGELFSQSATEVAAGPIQPRAESQLE